MNDLWADLSSSLEKFRMEPRTVGMRTYYVILNQDGVPVAQGIKETCQGYLDKYAPKEKSG